MQKDMREYTYVAQPKHRNGTHSMRQHSHAKYLGVSCTHYKIPHEIAEGKALAQPTATQVTPCPLLPEAVAIAPPHLPLIIAPDHPQAQPVDDNALHKRHNVYVPIELTPPAQAGVDVWCDVHAEEGRDDVRDARVEECCKDNLVDMQR